MLGGFSAPGALPEGDTIALALPAGTDPGAQALRRYHQSGRYAQGVAQAAELALVRLKEKMLHLPAGARPAIVSDIDETVLSSWPSIHASGFTWQPERFDRLAHEGMQALAPMVALYRQVREMGVEIFYVTARGEDLAAATARNLAAEGLGDYTALILKPAGAPHDFKAAERLKIREAGYTILLHLGDQLGDLSGNPEDDILLPNPFYTL